MFPEYQTLFLIGFVGNFTGAVGDMWIASKLWRYIKCSDAMVLDSLDGTTVYSNDPQAVKIIEKTKKKTHQSNNSKAMFLIIFFVILAIQSLAPILLSGLGFQGTFRLGFEQFYLFELINSTESIEFLIDFLTTLVTTAFLYASYSLTQHIRTKSVKKAH